MFFLEGRFSWFFSRPLRAAQWQVHLLQGSQEPAVAGGCHGSPTAHWVGGLKQQQKMEVEATTILGYDTT